MRDIILAFSLEFSNFDPLLIHKVLLALGSCYYTHHRSETYDNEDPLITTAIIPMLQPHFLSRSH